MKSNEQDLITEREGKGMFVNVRVHCSDRLSEVIKNDVEETEMTIESVLGTALLEIFDTVEFDTITVQLSPDDSDGE